MWILTLVVSNFLRPPCTLEASFLRVQSQQTKWGKLCLLHGLFLVVAPWQASLDVAANHLLLGGTQSAGMIHDNGPMLVAAAWEYKRNHH